MVMLPGGPAIGVAVDIEGRPVRLRRLQFEDHRFGPDAFPQTQINATVAPRVEQVVTFVLRVVHAEMALEISATPYIFTFKLWDWARLGLDGQPRPIHLKHGVPNIQWDRTTGWVRENLISRPAQLGEGLGWREERTGLHELEFIETRRHWFTGTTHHDDRASVNVLNLVEGREALVESPDGVFEPSVVHYAETFIVPVAAGPFTVRPHGLSSGRECATIKASVRL
jgi:hypothetical protein